MVVQCYRSVIGSLVLILSVSYSATLLAESVVKQQISNFSTNGLAGWEEKSFKGNTVYLVVNLDGEKVLQASSQASASGLYKKHHINLKQTPYLNWRWRIDNRINSGDETTKSGDDYVARVYLIMDGGVFFWNTSALSYVWANTAAKGSTWDNAYAGKSVKMLTLRSAGDETKKWLTEKRNVYADLKQLFGKEITTIDAVALMTDTDNSGSAAKSYYTDIHFSKD